MAALLVGCQSAPEPVAPAPAPAPAPIATQPTGGGAAVSKPRVALPPELEVTRQRREVEARNHAERGRAELAARRYDAGITALESCLATIAHSEVPLGLEDLERDVQGVLSRARLDKLEHDRAAAIQQAIDANRLAAEEEQSGMGRR